MLLSLFAGTYLTYYTSQLDTSYIALRTTVFVRLLLSAISQLATLCKFNTRITGDRRFYGIGTAHFVRAYICGAP